MGSMSVPPALCHKRCCKALSALAVSHYLQRWATARPMLAQCHLEAALEASEHRIHRLLVLWYFPAGQEDVPKWGRDGTRVRLGAMFTTDPDLHVGLRGAEPNKHGTEASRRLTWLHPYRGETSHHLPGFCRTHEKTLGYSCSFWQLGSSGLGC